jgi:hypothetical protein
MYKTGQIIRAKVDHFPLVDHYGIVIVENGNTNIIHNTPFRSSVKDDINTWLDSRSVMSIYNSNLVNENIEYINYKFKNDCKGKYNLFSYNCEHFIDCMTGKKQNSEQLNYWIILIVLKIVITLFLYYFFSKR